jgi:hypothetical protein
MKHYFLVFLRSPDDGSGAATTFDDLIQAVTDETTAEDSAVALLVSDKNLIDTLQTQVNNLLSGATVSPAVQAKIDQLFASAKANAQKLADAITANTPAQ